MKLPAAHTKAYTVFRYLCLLTAVANGLGNVAILVLYKPILGLLKVPLPQDVYSFASVACLSFSVGVLAFMVFVNPEKNAGLLVVGIVGKTAFALVTFYFYFAHDLHWFYVTFGAWDAAFAVIFFLFLIYLQDRDLVTLTAGEIQPGLSRPTTHRALFLGFSLTGNGKRGMERIEAGLQAQGYTVDWKLVEPAEGLFHFPMTLGEFVRIMLRSIFRRPATIKPLGIPEDHPYDLIVVEAQTWFLGMSAPIEAVFQEPGNRRVFAGRDTATLNVCRGLWRRSQAMLVRWLEVCGARVVGCRAYANPGWEPARVFSLFLFLGYGQPGRPACLRRFLQPQWLGPEALAELERFGVALGARRRVAYGQEAVLAGAG